MGIDLIPISNHTVSFSKRRYSDIAKEIISVLDREKENILMLYQKATGDVPDELRHKEWQYYKFIDYKEPYRKIEFFINSYDFFDLDRNKILFNIPVSRYFVWFEMSEEERNVNREMIFYMARLFGGNRIIYLPDNAHPLEEFVFTNYDFEEMEEILLKRYGPPKKTWAEVLENYENSYFIDYF